MIIEEAFNHITHPTLIYCRELKNCGGGKNERLYRRQGT